MSGARSMIVPHSPPEQGDGASRPARRIGVFGSTGSIGRSALDVIERTPDRFEVGALVAGSNVDLLVEQAVKHRPALVALADRSRLPELRSRLSGQLSSATVIDGGPEFIAEAAGGDSFDCLLAAIVGFDGLASVLSAVRAGKRVALANKESLVCGGALVMEAQHRSGALLLPVDSEHSALFQAMQGHHLGDISRLTLTASGGPFLRTPISELSAITPEQAVRHPRWSMGAKISIDSATLMNKALEVIETYWLFGVGPATIGVVIHPQSIVHSVVEFGDGSQLAQLSVPDMRGPISYALSYPGPRAPSGLPRLDLGAMEKLEFLPLDEERFPAIALARACLESGGAMPAVFNIANEIAVQRFRDRALRFDQIVRVVELATQAFAGAGYSTFEDLLRLAREVEGWVVAAHP